MNMNIISWLVLLSLLLLLYYLFVCSSGALFVRPCRVGTVRVCGWFGYADKSRRRENMVGVNMVLAEIIQLLKVICYNPCFHVGGSLRWKTRSPKTFAKRHSLERHSCVWLSTVQLSDVHTVTTTTTTTTNLLLIIILLHTNTNNTNALTTTNNNNNNNPLYMNNIH